MEKSRLGAAGLGCSALLPLTISFSQKELTTIAASVAGGLIAFYQVGYGIAAFGVGPLQTWSGLDLNIIYGGTAIVALAMFSVVLRRRAKIFRRLLEIYFSYSRLVSLGFRMILILAFFDILFAAIDVNHFALNGDLSRFSDAFFIGNCKFSAG